MSKSTILLDFDGVIRHWSSSDIDLAEQETGLSRGTLFSIAFSDKHLSLAITGAIVHGDWVDRVHCELTKLYGESAATALVNAWGNATWEIDDALLGGIKRVAPEGKFVLVTNATSNLDADLKQSGLKTEFDVVVNSSDIGYAKPDSRYFEKALSLSNCLKEEAIYIDDTIENINAAAALGIDGIHHENVLETLFYVEARFGNRGT